MKHFIPLCLLALPFSCWASLNVTNLKVCSLREPLGIDTSTPTFSWQLESSERGCQQVSYSITVADTNGNTMWDSGTLPSKEQLGIVYQGAPLKSRTAYTWTVTVTDNLGQTAQQTSTFETAFLSPDEWTAKWIGKEKQENIARFDIVLDEPVTCRYVRLDITKLGLPAAADPNYRFVQLDEMEIYADGENVARSAKFTATNTWTVGNWNISYVNDGRIKDAAYLGWTTQQNPSTPIRLTADLGTEKTIQRIVLYPRQDGHALGDENRVANFPATFTIQTATENKTNAYSTAFAATDMDAPEFKADDTRVPYFKRDFDLSDEKTIRRARIYASALGVFTMQVNGQPVTDARLEPGESEYEKTILYSTYDVTSLLQKGKNTVQAQVAGGIYNIEYLTGRFSKGEVTNNGETALLAELFIEYGDGTTDLIVTDQNWQTSPSATLGSNWWGGEDYDARLKDDLSWQSAHLITPHFTSPHAGVSGHGQLRSRMYEPLRVVEEWKAVDVKTIQSGGYTLTMVDFGRNFAGQYRFTLKGKRGQEISLRCGESLNPDGSVFMEEFYTGPADTYDIYTFAGDEEGETWGPEFMYHGFRYLQIIGLDEQPDPSAFTAQRIRSDVEQVGNLQTSNPLINDIHTLCRDAIASQLYNSITDCPHREKLGWLDVPNEMYVSLNSNFDMQAFYNKVVMDCFDAQQANGMVPSVAPFYMRVYEDDPNWGGTAILVPYRNWRFYGDKTLMTRYYDSMKRLIAHYTAGTTNHIINNSFSVLSDWGQETAGVSPLVPTEFTETTTYYYMLRAMAEMAEELEHGDDAATYQSLADEVKAAFNQKFYKGNGVYANGRQSEQAMPLYYGLVEPENEPLVAQVLAQRVRSDNYKIKTGEIALKPLFMSLAKYGYNDIVWQMANQTDCPSYGYWVEQGYTTTPEYWDVGRYSQNHCMMDHIEEWFFTQLAGIQNTGTAFDSIAIRPFIPVDLDHLDISTVCPRGTIRTAWQRTDGTLRCEFTVPAGSVATITLPLSVNMNIQENEQPLQMGKNGIHSFTRNDDAITLTVGSGNYTFTVGTSQDQSAIDAPHLPSYPQRAFNLSGIPVPYDTLHANTLQRGIYIVDGRKTYIK
ncbi:MAG: family 78 glycoside hydrolase catalytic domain [Bacteroidaceae bacterium]|nr:family 78 glycoside hydrolase catalytic domain [Bacteroidaceae bacterium]